MNIGDVGKCILWIKNNWVRPSALAGALLLALFVSLYTFNNYDLFEIVCNTNNLNNTITVPEIIFTLTVLIIIPICWYINRKTPKAKSGTIGIAIAILCESEEEEKQIKNDFIDALKELLDATKGKYPFDLVILPKHIVQEIKDDKTLYAARDNANCKFIIKGKVLVRGSNGEQTLIIDLSKLLIAHKPIDINSSQQLSKEMTYVMGKKYLIPKKNEFEEIEITVHYVDIATVYLIATVAQLSNELDYAETLLIELDKKIKAFNIQTSKYRNNITRIRKILPHRLATLYLQMAYQSYAQWLKEHNINEIQKVKALLDKSINLSKNIYDVYILRAICLFIINRNAKQAINELKRWNGTKDGTWFYNIAFLYAYEGDLFSAHKFYNKAFDRTATTIDVFIQVEEFINWLLTQERDKAQLHFCIALINYYGKKDEKLALDEFKLFIASADAKFEKHKTIANQMIKKIMSTFEQK